MQKSVLLIIFAVMAISLSAFVAAQPAKGKIPSFVCLPPQALTCTNDIDCDDSDICTIDICDIETGSCIYNPNPACIDDDSDDFAADVDCNDKDASINPGAAEICNYTDDNCDELIDEGFPTLNTLCFVGAGQCQSAGIQICTIDGTGIVCSAILGTGSAEVCDGFDNDCDGSTDEGLTDPFCASQTGVCSGSTQTCGGSIGFLTCGASEFGPDYEAVETTCDGLDNDCDGSTDNGLPSQRCALQTGVCSGATQTCGGASGYQTCSGAEYGSDYEAVETTCDGLDNDCDGLIDEGFSDLGNVCIVGIGACQNAGTRVCDISGSGTVCNAAPGTPSTETCDGIDNDCDGFVDESGICEVVDADSDGFLSDVDCNDANALINPGATDVSGNDIDENCDNTVVCFNDFDSDGFGTATSQESTFTATNSVADTSSACGSNDADLFDDTSNDCNDANAGINPGATEVCDGIDSNCDGIADDDLAGSVEACQNTNAFGTCTGTATCLGSSGLSACTAPTPSAEVCDGVDNNCDGSVDEGGVCFILVINEIMIYPSAVSDTNGEWFELYNPTSLPVDLNGFVIRDDGTDSHTIASSVIIPANGFVILGNNANLATNGGVVVDYQYSNFILSNTGDELVIETLSTEIDRVSYGSAFVVNGKSEELSINHLNSVENDFLANWCDAVSALPGGDLGTPGSLNDCSMLSITTSSLEDGVIGIAYTQTVQAAGGIPPLVWGISAGALPTGLSLDAGTGVISGTPSVVGIFSFDVSVIDFIAQSTSKNFVVNVMSS